MGRLMDRLRVTCRECGHNHVPHRLSARFHDGDRRRIQLWMCKECKHIWEDSLFKNRSD